MDRVIELLFCKEECADQECKDACHERYMNRVRKEDAEEEVTNE